MPLGVVTVDAASMVNPSGNLSISPCVCLDPFSRITSCFNFTFRPLAFAALNMERRSALSCRANVVKSSFIHTVLYC